MPKNSYDTQAIYFAITLFLLAFFINKSSIATPLFRDLIYGTSIAEFDQKQPYYDCSSVTGYTARCTDNLKFLGYDFDVMVLGFVGDRLHKVEIIAQFKPEIYYAVSKALLENFSLISLHSGQRRLDILEIARQEGPSITRSRISEIESVGLENLDLIYNFIESRDVRSFSSSRDAIIKLPPTTRFASMSINSKNDVTVLQIIFSLPRRALEDMNTLPMKKEKF